MWFCWYTRQMPPSRAEQLSAYLLPVLNHQLSKGRDGVLLCLVHNLACGSCPKGSHAYEPTDE